jgi:hypothetical protein
MLRPRNSSRIRWRQATSPDAREQDAREYGGYLEQDDPHRGARLERDIARGKVADDHCERPDADRAVVRGERRRVGPCEAADVVGDCKRGQGQHETQQEDGAELGEGHGAGVACQLDAALETDRQQQHRAHELVDCARQAQVGPGRSRRDAEDEEPDHGIELWHARSRGNVGGSRNGMRIARLSHEVAC